MWTPRQRSVFGLSYRHNLGAMCRSVMEGVTFSLRDILEIIHETNNLTVTESGRWEEREKRSLAADPGGCV